MYPPNKHNLYERLEEEISSRSHYHTYTSTAICPWLIEIYPPLVVIFRLMPSTSTLSFQHALRALLNYFYPFLFGVLFCYLLLLNLVH